MSTFIRLITILAFMLFTTWPAFSALAQLTGDPANMPQPVYPYEDPNRAVVIRINFDSDTEVELLEVLVANTRAKTAIGAPPQLLLELYDHNDQLISTRNAWHPLLENQWDETGEIESEIKMDSGEGTFYLPLSSSLRKVRVTDLELAQELITVDVSEYVITYCQSNPDTPICVLFMDGFE